MSAYPCAVERDLTEYQRRIDADEAADEAQEAEVAAERARAESLMRDPTHWGWDSGKHVLCTGDGVPYNLGEILYDAQTERAPGVDAAYAALLASPEAQALRDALVDHWLQKMWGG